jgi:hypothetical protein
MAAGDFPAGEGPAGLDPVLTSAPLERFLAGAARKYDPSIQDWASDDRGNHTAAHPVDQQMVTCLTMAAKSIRSAADQGSDFFGLEYIDPQKQDVIVTRILERSVIHLTSTGRAQIISIVVQPDKDRNRTLAAVTYKNLETGKVAPTVNV